MMSKPIQDETRVARPQARNAARLMAFARWKGTTPEERSALMRAAGKKGGRPRSTRRCFCGAASMLTAALRNFDCCRKAGRIILVGALRATSAARVQPKKPARRKAKRSS